MSEPIDYDDLLRRLRECYRPTAKDNTQMEPYNLLTMIHEAADAIDELTPTCCICGRKEPCDTPEACTFDPTPRAMYERMCKAETAIEAQDKTIAELRDELGAKQALIDSLMLEFCPEEMTKAQIENWARHQAAMKEAT